MWIDIGPAPDKSVAKKLSSGCSQGRCKHGDAKGYEVADVFHNSKSGQLFIRAGMQRLIETLENENESEYVVIVEDGSRRAREIVTHAKLRSKIGSLGALLDSSK